MGLTDLRRDLESKYRLPRTAVVVETEAPPEVDLEKAFVVQGEHRTLITAPIREVAAVNQGFTYLRGRFVGADKPNRNNAMWTTEDLELGEATVAGGPLNWLHDEDHVVGCILDGNLVKDREAASGIGNHIVSTAVVWKFLNPGAAATIEKAAADGQLFYSMECLSRAVACVGDTGCGQEVSYEAYDAKGPDLCQHLRERSGVRRFVDPYFLGGAVIVPPVAPGWEHASVEVVRQAASLSEREHLADHLTKDQAMDLATRVLAWANRD